MTTPQDSTAIVRTHMESRPTAPVGPVDASNPFANCVDLVVPTGTPTQTRVKSRLPDGRDVTLIYGYQDVTVSETWSTWTWRVLRGALVATVSRLVWMIIGVLAFTHPSVTKFIASLTVFN
jgi:hypothetical protein